MGERAEGSLMGFVVWCIGGIREEDEKKVYA